MSFNSLIQIIQACNINQALTDLFLVNLYHSKSTNYLPKKMKTLFRKLTYLTAALALLSTSTYAQDGKTIFGQNCAACHTVGGGRLVGPDLQGVNYKRDAEWLTKFIQSSQALIKSGDPEAVEIFEQYNKMIMPDQGVSASEVSAIVAYIKGESPEPAAEGEETVEVVEVVEFTSTPEDVQLGKDLFLGDVRFENSGVTCISCHNVSSDNMIPGGKLAADLTTAYSRLGGANGIKAILSSPPFPAMKVSYEDHELTEDEIFKLQAFLKNADENSIYHIKSEYNSFFGWSGFFVLLTLLSLIAVIWAKQKRGHVKEDIYKRQTQTNYQK